MSDLNDETTAEDLAEDSGGTEVSVEDSVEDSAEQSDDVSEVSEGAFDYLDETETPQADVDAQNLFKKFATMTDTQKADKLKALESRPQTLEALNELLGTDAYQEEVTEEQDVDESDSIYLERMRFQSAIEDFSLRNKLSDEVVKELKNPVGAISKAFRNLKFDPSTGEALSYTQKLKMALSQSEVVQNALNDSKANTKVKGMMKANTAKMRNGGGGSTKIDLESLRDSDPAAYLKAMDKNTAESSRYM